VEKEVSTILVGKNVFFEKCNFFVKKCFFLVFCPGGRALRKYGDNKQTG